MDIASIKQTSAVPPANQSSQDSHEINIQKQIVNLQEKMRSIAYDSQMSAEEKSNEKKELQGKIQNLNNELKQYQIQKRQEEAEKRQKEAAKKQAEEAKRAEEPKTSTTSASSQTADGQSDESVAAVSAKKQADRPDTESASAASGTMFSTANTKEHLAQMQKIRTNLEGKMRTASTDEQKAKLQKRINNVAKTIGEKIQKISEAIANTQNEDKVRKEKVQKQLEEYREKTKNVNTSVSKTSGTSGKGKYWKDDSTMPGKVLITRKKS